MVGNVPLGYTTPPPPLASYYLTSLLYTVHCTVLYSTVHMCRVMDGNLCNKVFSYAGVNYAKNPGVIQNTIFIIF